ncbi:MAG: hypothetical protein JFR39_08075 [Muribaculaceae bacterium]|nr:hypothetical protein [Muribaculaceae bacterium]
MLIKYFIEIDDIKTEVPQYCVKNWDEIQCVFRRVDYSGITRSFTSKFEFVGETFQLLLNHYLRDGINAIARLCIMGITDIWAWSELFCCNLDFSTIVWTENVLSISCVDNSLASMIKANKNTKYEFVVGEDVQTDSFFHFERIPMVENVTYGFTQGESIPNSADLLVTQTAGNNIWVGNIGKEISIGGHINWRDDQTGDDDGYLLEACRDIKIKLDYHFGYREDIGSGMMKFYVKVRRNGSIVNGMGGAIGSAACTRYRIEGSYMTPQELPAPTSDDFSKGNYALVDNVVWVVVYMGWHYAWRSTGKTPQEYFNKQVEGNVILSLQNGDKVFIESQIVGAANSNTATIRFTASSFMFSWEALGTSCDVDAIAPVSVITSILRRIVGNTLNVSVAISNHDSRFANTYLLASESVRGLENAKLYSSFNDFAEWLEVVFGYTYYLEAPVKSKFKRIVTVGAWLTKPTTIYDTLYTGDVNPDRITFVESVGRIVYVTENDHKMYARWEGWEEYSSPEHMRPYSNCLYRMPVDPQNNIDALYSFPEYEEGVVASPVLYDFDETSIKNDHQIVRFVHRSELFEKSKIHKIDLCNDATYTIDNAHIFSNIEIGYKKIIYNSINGRGEFNFTNKYTTGCTVSDKSLKLISKYRCDSYGIEFMAQKRGAESTDNESDTDVFFVLCKKQGIALVPMRSVSIENAFSDMLFNGEFSPIACARANAGIIGMQSKGLSLECTSSDGCSIIKINGENLDSTIHINTPLISCGIIEFTSSKAIDNRCLSDLIEVNIAGVTYRGYIQEVTIKYAKEEAVKYKLLVKEIVL